MAGKQSWAEKRWWRGTVFDWMGVLLALALIFVVAFVSVPFLLFRHTVTSGLQDYYLNVYRSTCATGERRTAALPYVLQSNGVRRLASSADVVVVPPAPSASLRLTLSKAAITSRVKGLQFVRVSAWRTDPACAELSRQIQANALANRRGIPWWMLLPAAAIPVAITIGYARHRRKAKKMRRGQTLRGSELLSEAQFNRLKRGDGIGFSTRHTVSVLSLLLGRSGHEVIRVARQDEPGLFGPAPICNEEGQVLGPVAGRGKSGDPGVADLECVPVVELVNAGAGGGDQPAAS